MSIARVQFISGTGITTTCVATLGSSPTNGNFLVAVIGTSKTSTSPVTSITQTGATWVQAVSTDNANGVSMDIWYAENVSGAGTTVTANLSGTLNSSMIVAEYSGIKTSGSIDQTASNTDTSVNADSGTTASTSQRNELWVSGLALVVGGLSWQSPTNGFTNVSPLISTISIVLEQKIVSTAGTANTSNITTVQSAPSYEAGCMATFKDVNPGMNSGFFFLM